MESARSTDQTNPEQCRHLGVDKGSKESDRTVKVRVSTPNPSDPLSYDRFITEKYVSPVRDIFEEYTSFVLSVASQKTSEGRIQQGIIGATTETGELLDALKKHMFQDRPIDEINIKEECGDVWFYLTEILAAIDSDIFEIMEINTAKLFRRYPNGFDRQKSIDRDTDQEREILEETSSKSSCESCADTVCGYAGQEGTAYERFKDNRNYPIDPPAQKLSDAERFPPEPTAKNPCNLCNDIACHCTGQKDTGCDKIKDRENPPEPAKKACCGNCAKRLTLKGCSRYVKTHDEGCCIDHKFLSEGDSK